MKIQVENKNDDVESLFSSSYLLIFMTRGDVRVMVIWTALVTW